MNRWSPPGRPRPGLRASGTERAPQAGGPVASQPPRPDPSRRTRGVHKTGPQSLGRSRGGGIPKIPLGAAEASTTLVCSRSPGHAVPAGRQWLTRLSPVPDRPALLRDRADEGAKTRHLAGARGEELWGTATAPPGWAWGGCPGTGHAAHRHRARGTSRAGMPSPLLALRATRRASPRMHRLRPHHRGSHSYLGGGARRGIRGGEFPAAWRRDPFRMEPSHAAPGPR